MKIHSWMLAALLILAPAARSAAQPLESIASLLVRFDAEHDLSAKERLLRTVTANHPGAGPSLLKLAESTANPDTRWMAMRGMVDLHYAASAPFLVASLKNADVFVRSNAARALGDLQITAAADALLAMFAAENDPGAVEQASLALRMLDIKAGAPYVREKIPAFTGQTRHWLIQALGTLGNAAEDVPFIAEYLYEPSHTAPADAIGELTGVSFGPRKLGLGSYPPPEILAARAWWESHKDAWPRCDECRQK